MLTTKAHKTISSLVLGIACFAAADALRAAAPVKLSGAITGVVSDSVGTPQMGATILLFNRQDRPFGKALSDERGEFKFLGLFPDVYSIRVTLATFVPAVKKDILVQPGMRSVLNVNLNNVFSTIQFAYPQVTDGSFMTDEWKWVLRSAPSTRPVLRFAQANPRDVGGPARPGTFSETRGIVRLSAGEGSLASGLGTEADLGTAFAMATSLSANSMLRMSGTVGYGSETGVPATAFRTRYSRNMGMGSPEVSLTMRQMILPGRIGAAITGAPESALPKMRSLSAGFEDRTQLSDEVSLQYGFTLESVTFLDRLNYFSPYGRLAYTPTENDEIDMAYTSGNARPDLGGSGGEDAELQRDMNSLGIFPRVSVLGGRAKVQRGDEFEITYSHKSGSRTYSASAHHASVTNAALMLVGADGLYGAGDILPDLFTGSSIFNAGGYRSAGYSAAVTQDVGEHFSATLMFGSMGALTTGRQEIVSDNPDELRSMIREGRRRAATARITATVPRTGTHMIASYQWVADPRSVAPGNLYSTQAFRPTPGFNLYIRQPIPGLSTRVEATAEFQNMLAQGYLPMGTVNGHQVMLVQIPRSFRGGLAFIF
jgi:hypothetical protein